MVKLKILKIVLKFIGILIIIAIIGGIGITLTQLNQKPVSTNIEDENIEQMQEEISQEEMPIELAEEIKEEIPVISNDIVTEQKTSSNNQNATKQENKTTATLPVTSNTGTTPSDKPGGVENTNNDKPVKCTNNDNHGTDVGKSKNGALGWYNTKAQAVAVYTAKVNEGSAKWGNYEITTEEYEKNYPSSYEVWTCYLCGKWTINFNYDK